MWDGKRQVELREEMQGQDGTGVQASSVEAPACQYSTPHCVREAQDAVNIASCRLMAAISASSTFGAQEGGPESAFHKTSKVEKLRLGRAR